MLDKIKNFLRISHSIDDNYLNESIELAKELIKQKTGVAYSTNDLIFEKAIMMLVAYYYDTRTIITEKSVYTLPYTVDELLKTLAFRGAKNE